VWSDDLGDPQLLARVVRFYAHRLRHSPAAHDMLTALGLANPDLLDAFPLGLSDGHLLHALTPILKARLLGLGLLNETRTGAVTEVLDGCIVIPVDHPRHGVTAFYGLPDSGPIRQLVLRPGGLLNWPALRLQASVHVTEDVRDALALWQAGLRAVTCLPASFRTLDDLAPLLALWRGAPLVFWGGPDTERVLHRHANELAVRGLSASTIPLAYGESPHQLWLEGGATGLQALHAHSHAVTRSDSDLDLALWQGRFREHLALAAYAERSIEPMVAELAPLFAYLHGRGVTSLAALTPPDLEGYRLALYGSQYRGRRLSLNTQAHRMSAVKAFTRFLRDTRYTLTDPGKEVRPIRVPRRGPEVWLSEDETVRLLTAPPVHQPLGLRDRAMLELFYGSALRNEEMCRLELDALDLAKDELYVRYGKGNKRRVVPLGGEARYWLESYLETVRPRLAGPRSGPVIFLTRRGRPFVRYNCTGVVRRAAQEAGFDKRITPHVLRHACATHMLRRGASLRYVQELLGHESPCTTQRYTRVDITDLHHMHQAFHPRGRHDAP
jgi:integrase/recombinase XerD